jgi:S-DNA-T family DNA segregation ATPase FtsK/SpoIIIE
VEQLGAIFAVPLISLIGNIGAIILSAGIALISSIFIFGVKPAKILKTIIDRAKARKLANKGYKEERRQESKILKKKEKEEEILDNQITIKLNNEPTLFKKEEETKKDKLKEVLVLEHAVTVEDQEYEFPPIDFLKEGKLSSNKNNKKIVADTVTKLQRTLYSFGVSAKVENVSVGPTITRYELKPAEGVRVNKIANLADDIALNLAAETIRIEAPIPGKQAVGIEIPNPQSHLVRVRQIMENAGFADAVNRNLTNLVL